MILKPTSVQEAGRIAPELERPAKRNTGKHLGLLQKHDEMCCKFSQVFFKLLFLNDFFKFVFLQHNTGVCGRRRAHAAEIPQINGVGRFQFSANSGQIGAVSGCTKPMHWPKLHPC
jgi:hypothetical protein